jgi:hypothetical protein
MKVVPLRINPEYSAVFIVGGHPTNLNIFFHYTILRPCVGVKGFRPVHAYAPTSRYGLSDLDFDSQAPEDDIAHPTYNQLTY